MVPMSSRISRRGAFAAAAAAGLGVPTAVAAAPPAQLSGPTQNLLEATYNASLNRDEAGALLRDLETGAAQQISAVSEAGEINDPAVLLITELDLDEEHRGLALLRRNYLDISHNGRTPVFYPSAYTAPVTTGAPSDFDLDGDGTIGGPEDAWGFGEFPGQYGMVILSRHPILTEEIRTFQSLDRKRVVLGMGVDPV